MSAPRLLCAVLLGAAVLTACGTGNAAVPAGPAVPTQDVVSGIPVDPAATALLPASVRSSGAVRLAAVSGGAPSSFFLSDNRTLVGLDVDIANAVARELGVHYDRDITSFDAILPALRSGRYQVGTGNFGVTTERLRTIDFVTYIDDGQAFATRSDSMLTSVHNLDQLCGLNIGTGKGTTFETTLEENAHVCADEGRKPYQVQSYADNGSMFVALRQHHIDVIMSTINGLRYAVSQQPGLKFLNEYHRLDVGFAFPKGSPLTSAFQAAVNKLISTGAYRRILAKWGVTGSAIPASEINPPERN